MARYKDKLLEQFYKDPIKVGDYGYVDKSVINGFNSDKGEYFVKVIEVVSDKEIVVYHDEYKSYKKIDASLFKRSTLYVGYDPFEDDNWRSKVKTHSFDIEGILLECGIERKSSSIAAEKYFGVLVPEINFNPYVFDKNGEKKYYQRNFVWTLKDKQLLIRSLYNGINCGSVLLRKHSFNWIENQIKSGNTEVAFKDVVDGKQRLNTLIEFVLGIFPDENGFYFSDLPDRAKSKFRGLNSISYSVLEENATDEDTLNCFILMNSGGVTIDNEHIEKVKNILK